MITVKDIYSYIDELAPYETQESWDNSGLNVGSFQREVKTVGFALDATKNIIKKAKNSDCDLLITHHPVIFSPLSHIYNENPAYYAIQNNIDILSAHTNWDACDGGVNDILAEKINLKSIKRLTDSSLSMIRVGETEDDFETFLENVKNQLNNKTIINNVFRKPHKVAVCGGSGGSLLNDVYLSGIDTLVTGEAKHSDFITANNLNINLFVCGHYETENISVPVLKSKIENKFENLNCILFDENPIIR